MLLFDASKKWPERLISDSGDAHNNIHDTTRDVIEIVHWLNDDGKVQARLNFAGRPASDFPPNARRSAFTIQLVIEQCLRQVYSSEALEPK